MGKRPINGGHTCFLLKNVEYEFIFPAFIETIPINFTANFPRLAGGLGVFVTGV